ncbi:MAG: fabZ [Verrucomicrobia bacterium]|jgi:3-hydroxyacyl-[acyl-carrier-protein] dehydratase|nr:fabZ [Verrucomicrobiota bacterium]
MSDDSLQRALAALPHGTEFRFVDRLLALEPGQRGAGEYLVRGDEPFLKGHFPGHPLLPGVLLIEAIAQLAGTVAQSDPIITPLAGLKLTAVRNAKILGTATPGQTVSLSAEVLGRMGNLIQTRGEATVNGQRVLAVELTLSGENTSVSK